MVHTIESLLFMKNRVDILNVLSNYTCNGTIENEDIFPSRVARRVGITYSHSVKLIDLLLKSGCLTKIVKGRKHVLVLTDRGKEISRLLNNIKEIGSRTRKHESDD